jgi:rhodanese-related sulfurtransferase
MKNAILCAVVFLCAVFSYAVPKAEEPADTANVTCEQAFELIKAHEGDTNFVIIDFRPVEKYKNAYLENAIFYDVFSDSVDVWLETLDKNKIYLIYCTVGHRSGIALEKMRAMGFGEVYHMYEGIRVWKVQGYKTLSLEE